MTAQVIHGDCLDVLAGMGDSSVDAIVTDPPYEIGFMGKGWDGSGIAYRVELWAECLRVLKPGGHLLAFGGTRTYHRMASAIDDAGFDIRDSLHWLYGSGFPKSLDVSKAIDKAAGAEREVVGEGPYSARRPRQEVEAVNAYSDGVGDYGSSLITAPATDAARQWAGYGTALKPAHEPIVVARKPLTGTVAANVLTHGTGALNIDGSRVGCTDKTPFPAAGYTRHDTDAAYEFGGDPNFTTTGVDKNPQGRWPANLVLTHAADCTDTCADGCPVAELDGQSGTGKGTERTGPPGGTTFGGGTMNAAVGQWFGDTGGASRFFTVTEWDPTADVPPFRYVAKPSKRERNAGLDGLAAKFAPTMNDGIGGKPHNAETATPKQNHHPTVKPVALMRWLVRLVTPPGGTVLDPFAGSGTTLVAATLEGFDSIGIELTADYLPIIAGRVQWAEAQPGTPPPARAPTTPRTATPTTEPPLTLFDVGATE